MPLAMSPRSGYVRIDYCKKPLSEILAEIDTYAAWSREPGLAVQGIFVDETPNHYSAEKVEYLGAIKHTIRSALTSLADSSLVSLSIIVMAQLLIRSRSCTTRALHLMLHWQALPT
jgi:hypothetical protein